MIYTSYFAVANKLPKGMQLVSISRQTPKGFKCETLSNLAPSWDLINTYKSRLSKEEYTVRYYREVLSTLDPIQILKQLEQINPDGDVAMLCYESAEKFCHRHLVADWLMLETDTIVTEWNLVNKLIKGDR